MSTSDPMKRARKRWRWLLWVLPVGLLAWTLARIEIADVVRVLQRVTPLELVLLLTLNIGVLATFSGRWWSVLQGQGNNVSYWRVALYRLMGAGVSYFTPGPHVGGEPLQVVLLQERAGVVPSAAISSVTADKLLELLSNATMLLFGCAVVLHVGVLPTISVSTLVLPLLLMCLPIVLMILLWRGQKPVSSLFGLLPEQLAPANRMHKVREVIEQTEGILVRLYQEQPKAILVAVAFSLLSWVGIGVEYWLATSLLGLRLPVIDVIIMLTAARIAILLPSPGGLGTYEASQVLIFGVLEYDPAVALALSLLVRGRDLLFMGIGLVLAAYSIHTAKIFGRVI